MSDEPSPAALKDWFDEARYRAIARELAQLAPKFEAETFLKLVLDGLEERTLMERLHQCAVATDAGAAGIVSAEGARAAKARTQARA
jgi:hypothetical protein